MDGRCEEIKLLDASPSPLPKPAADFPLPRMQPRLIAFHSKVIRIGGFWLLLILWLLLRRLRVGDGAKHRGASRAF